MNARMLRRRLNSEGISLRQLTEESLKREACLSLDNPHESVSQIAERLGYSEPSAFHRAFKRWTGITPAQYQQKAKQP